MNRKLVAVTGALMLSLGACTPASYNLSNDSDNFRVMRRVVFVNGITDKWEQMDPASVDTYHYKVQFRPEELLPDIDVQVSGGDN